MNKNKGFVGVGIIVLIVLGMVVVGGGVYYLGKDKGEDQKIEKVSDMAELNNEFKNLPEISNKSQTKTDSKIITYESKVYGYSIGYKGIDEKNVYIEGEGKKVSLFPNQSDIDDIEIVDATYTTPTYMTADGMVTFGLNRYKRFKDNITERHTYFLISGLNNNKSMLISIEGDSNLPNYLDLSTLKINKATATVVKSSEESSSEVFSHQPGTIKSIKSDDTNKWILAVDLLSRNSKWTPGDDKEPFFLNQNTKIRSLNANISTETYTCGESLTNGAYGAFILSNPIDFIKKIRPEDVKYFDIYGTNINTIYDQCLP